MREDYRYNKKLQGMFFQKFWRQHNKRVFVAILFLLPFAPFVLKKTKLPKIHVTDLLHSYVLHPIASTMSSARTGIIYLWDSYINLINTQKQNFILLEKVASLEAQQLELSELTIENQRLKKLLSIPEIAETQSLGARVIGRQSDDESLGFYIDAGSKQGIKIGMPVITADGAVGSIRKVYSNSAMYVSILDPSHAIDGVVRRTRARMIVEGLGGPLLAQLKYLDRAEDVQVGDEVLTSGADGIFPKGLLIGNIVELHRPRHGVLQEARLRASVDIGKIEEVVVLLKNNPLQEMTNK